MKTTVRRIFFTALSLVIVTLGAPRAVAEPPKSQTAPGQQLDTPANVANLLAQNNARDTLVQQRSSTTRETAANPTSTPDPKKEIPADIEPVKYTSKPLPAKEKYDLNNPGQKAQYELDVYLVNLQNVNMDLFARLNAANKDKANRDAKIITLAQAVARESGRAEGYQNWLVKRASEIPKEAKEKE